MSNSEQMDVTTGGRAAADASVESGVSRETAQGVLDVVVLAGGISHERDVSLRSGRRVADALTDAGHRVTLRDPDAGLLPYLAEHRPDVLFPALHGSSGEDGSLLDLLSALGVPTVGSPAAAARRAWAKPVASSLVRDAGIAVPDSIVLSHEAFRELGASSVLRVVRAALPGDLVVKPASGGSAQGVTIVEAPDELARAMVDAFTYAMCGTPRPAPHIHSPSAPRLVARRSSTTSRATGRLAACICAPSRRRRASTCIGWRRVRPRQVPGPQMRARRDSNPQPSDP